MAFGRRKGSTAVESTPERPRARWRGLESAFTKIVMTLGIIGIGTALAAILGTQDVDAWIVGLVVALISVVLAALLWSRYRE